MNPLDQVRIALSELPHGEAMLVTSPATVRWLTGFTGSFGMAIVSADRAVFVTDSRYSLQAQAEVVGFDVEWFKSPTSAKGFLAEITKRLGISALGFEASNLSYSTFEDYRAALGVELVPVRDVLSALRMVKTEEEIDKIRRACELTDACFVHLQRMFTIGTSEYDLGLELEFYFRRHRAEIGFSPIVASGPNSAKPHARATERKLEAGDFLTLDFGAKLDGYNSDLTRTVVIGEPTPRHEEIYNQVLKAQLASLDAMLPGVPAKDVDALARTILDERDLAQFFGHSLGHGLGSEVHDVGKLGPGSPHVLAVGQVWTVEPGVYIDGWGGVRIEDDVVIREGGVEILNATTKELLVFG